MNVVRHVSLLLLLWTLTACVDGLPANNGADAGFGVENQALTTAEYPLATWLTSPNFYLKSRKPPDVQVIVIHTTQGTYQSAISWFQDPASQVSAHYVISKKGEITQMVLEKDVAWHVGSENSYTIGIEHEGMIDDPTWVTEPMLDASAKLCCYLLKKWQLPATKEHIKGHVELPNQTHKDPGSYWPWDTYLTKVQACMDPTVPSCGSCDDKNVCTTDSCVAAVCKHAAVAGPCDDGEPCTVGDYCAQGLCLSGATVGSGGNGGCGADAVSDTQVVIDSGSDTAPDTQPIPDVPAIVDVQADAANGDTKQSTLSDTSPDVAQQDVGPSPLVNNPPQSAPGGCQATQRATPPVLALISAACLLLWRAKRRRA